MVRINNAYDQMLTFITTNECSANCAHCLMMSNPSRHEKLTAKQIENAIDAFIVRKRSEVVVFTGGECTRLGDDLLEGIAYANTKGLITRIVSNAEWANDEQSTEQMISDLRAVGLNEINISYDDFHSAWIPIDNVIRVWTHCKNKGFSSVVLAVGSGPRSRITPSYMVDALQEDIPLLYDDSGNSLDFPEPSEDGTSYMISNSDILKIGRGRKLRDQYCRFGNQAALFARRCGKQNLQPVITPDYHVGACCGINPDNNILLDMGPVETYSQPDGLRKLFLNAVEVLGPGYLLRLIRRKQPGLRFGRKQYSSICEMCEDITTSKEAIAILEQNSETIRDDINAENILSSFSTDSQEHLDELAC